MRILYVSSARTFGGGERHAVDLANGMLKRGHQVYAALAPASPLREHLAQLPAQNIYNLRLRNALDLPSAVRLADIVRDEQIDIVHAHLARDYTLAAFASRKHARLVITRHLLRPLGQIHRLVLSRVARVIAVSESVALVLREQKLFPANKIRVVLNGIDLAWFCTGTPPMTQNFRSEVLSRLIPEDHLIVGTIGELRPHKGHSEFIRAAALVIKRFKKVSFVIAGEDSSKTKQHRTHLECLIANLNLNEQVHLINRLPDVRPLLYSLDLYVSSSRFESFGLVITEAMACGVPVVATATSGAQEIISNGVTGILVPVDDVNRLADAITESLCNADQRKQFSAAARDAVCQRFSLNRMVEATEQIYREALEAI